jgi:hypothetical protein
MDGMGGSSKPDHRGISLVFCLTLLATLSTTGPANRADAENPPAEPGWLTVVDHYRQTSHLPPVLENTAWSAAATSHSCYMLVNGITHDEVPGLPGYTPEGDAAAHNSNVAVSSRVNSSARSLIELWMTGPFHAIGILRPNLVSVGFGKCDSPTTPVWHSAATLDVLHGLVGSPGYGWPIVFPGDGATTSLDRFVTESPNPLEFCGWTGAAGLPLIAMMPRAFDTQPTATVQDSSRSLELCVLSALNTDAAAQSILASSNAIVVIPREPLRAGAYSVAITTSSGSVAWTFTIDPNARIDQASPPTTAPVSGSDTVEPLAPARIVDTRSGVGSPRLGGAERQRIQITGRGGVPDDAVAITANFTVTNTVGSGYLSVWNCSPQRPVVSTLNFIAGDTVPNNASVPLDGAGGLCVYASSPTDLLIDVNGYFAASDIGGRLTPVQPARLMDSRIGLGAAGRLSARTVTPLRVAGAAGVPVGVEMVALNVTSVLPEGNGFVTVYPCDVARPLVSNLNPIVGQTRPNAVITPVAADGTVCIYTLTDDDIVVDISGYISASGEQRFTPSVPFRLIDTRDQFRPEMQAGTNGVPMRGGQSLEIQVAGVRGIAGEARAVSVNLTAIGVAAPGFLSSWPCGVRPHTSVVNFVPTDAVANSAQMALSSDGRICVFASSPVDLIIDVNGWWS